MSSVPYLIEAANNGFAQGPQRKEALSDEERATKANQYMANLTHGQQRLATLDPSSREHVALAAELADQQEQLTDLFHPRHGPAAIHALGDLVSKHIFRHQPDTLPAQVQPVAGSSMPAQSGITLPGMGGAGPITTPNLPAAPAAKQFVPQTPEGLRHEAARRQVEATAATFGTPQDAQAVQARTDEYARQKKGRDQDFEIEWAKRHGISDAAMQELVAHQAGLPARAAVHPILKLYTLADGSKSWLDASQPDNIPAGATPVSGGAPKVGSFGDFVTAAFGDKPTPAQYEWARKHWTPEMQTVGLHEQQVPQPDGTIKKVSFETMSTRGPVGGSAGEAPSNLNARQDQAVTPPGSAQPSAAAPTVSAPTSPTPSVLKKQVKTAKTKAGVVNDGKIIGGRETSAQSAAHKEYDTAVALVDVAHRAQSASPDVKAGLQRQVASSLQVALDKRFNQTAFDNLVSSYGVANNFQAWLENKATGALPDAIFKQLVAIAESNAQGKNEAWKAAMKSTPEDAPAAPATTGAKPGDPLGVL